MADTFSLVVNIFTLLEFGRKFATLAWAIHKDGKDAVSKVTSLDMTSKDLSKIACDLSQPVPSSGVHNEEETTERTHQLAKRCIKVAGQMQETISGLGTHTSSRRKGSAMLKAFKYKWKEDEIVAFQSEIEDLRSELMLNLILWIRAGMMKSLDNQDRMIRKLSEPGSHDGDLENRLNYLTTQQEGFVQRIVEILSLHATAVVDSNRPETSLETDLMTAMKNSPQQMGAEDAARLQMPSDRLLRIRKQFIGMLRYDSMFDREAGVAEAHTDTLKWIFVEPSGQTRAWDDFSQWLESADQLYWITGKMGSGKSTLMKYISEELPTTSAAGTDRRCTPHLLRWAQESPLFIASFYFWAGSNEETKMQTSVEGLYRTLLTQILEAYPGAAPRVSPRRWEDLCLFNKESKAPGIPELRLMLRKAIEYVSSVAKVCLFIDGLDEFEGKDDDLRDLVTWVKILVETSPIKLCVASRPWHVFENALQDQPHLRMEDFNSPDIQKYVWRRFHDDSNFRAKIKMEADFCNQLLDELVTKAEGVFLWVQLVCTSLLQAMSRGDLISDLRRILNALPVQMENLYSHILDNLDFRDHAAKYLLLIQAFLGRPDALIFSFADDIGEDADFSLKIARESLTEAELQYRGVELRKRLNSRCRGLLSLSTEPSHSTRTTAQSDIGAVQYCHRSAKDYFEMETIHARLIEMLDAPFDPHLRLCSAYLARWKCCASDASESECQASMYKCAEHAAKVTSECSDQMIRVLDDLNPDFRAQFYLNEDYFGRYPCFGGSLLSFTVVLGVSQYVKGKIVRDQGCVVRSSSVRLAWGGWAIDKTGRSEISLRGQRDEVDRMQQYLQSRGEELEWPLLVDALLAANQPNPEIVSLLLKNGADSNPIIRCADWEKSALDMVLFRLRGFGYYQLSNLPDAKRAWVDSLRLLLRHGAEPDRSDVRFLRIFIGEDVVQSTTWPRLGRRRAFFSKVLALLRQ